MTLQELEQALEKAKADLETWQARGVLLNECSHTWMDGMTQRSDAILAAERALSAARGEVYAMVWTEGLGLRSNTLPRVFVRPGRRVTLLAPVPYIPPDWKGKIIGENLSYTDESPLLRVEYSDAEVQAVKPGPIEHHRLYRRGLDPREMMQVIHPNRKDSVQHHLMIFEGAWIEIQGKPTSVEVWTVSLKDAARHSAGTPLPL